MKTILFYLTLCTFLSTSLYAQKSDAFYQKIVDTTKNEKLKFVALDTLLHRAQYKKHKEYADFVEQYVNLGLKLKEYDKSIEQAINSIHSININLGQRERALKLLNKVESYKKFTKDTYLLAGINLKKGGIYSNGKDHDKAIAFFTKAINLYENKDSIYKADAIYFRGNNHFYKGNYLKAIEDYRTASTYYEKLGDKDYTFYTLGSIISIYGSNGFHKKTIYERKNLIKKKIEANAFLGLESDYINQASNFSKLKDNKNQKRCLYEALKHAKKSKNEFGYLSLIYTLLGNYYIKENNLSTAKKYLDSSKAILKNNKETTNNFLNYQLANSRYLLKTGKKNEALNEANKALKSINKFKKVSLKTAVNKLLFEIYNAKDNTDRALKYYQKYTKIKDSVYNTQKTNAIAFYQTLYETERKEKEITLQQTEISLLEKDNNAKKRLLIFISISALLLTAFGYLYWNRRYLKKQKEAQEKYSQDLLTSQEEERKRISKDLHDSLGQSLLLIKNKVVLKKDENTQKLVDNAIEEMRSISRTLHPFQLETIGISKALENLVHQLDESYPKTMIFGEIDFIDDSVNKQQEINIFRIVQECFSNIVKHAKADSAKVSVYKNERSIKVLIEDNGIGFDFSERYNDFKSLGLKTIKERVNILNGSLKIDSTLGSGTKFSIIIPVNI